MNVFVYFFLVSQIRWMWTVSCTEVLSSLQQPWVWVPTWAPPRHTHPVSCHLWSCLINKAIQRPNKWLISHVRSQWSLSHAMLCVSYMPPYNVLLCSWLSGHQLAIIGVILNSANKLVISSGLDRAANWNQNNHKSVKDFTRQNMLVKHSSETLHWPSDLSKWLWSALVSHWAVTLPYTAQGLNLTINFFILYGP